MKTGQLLDILNGHVGPISSVCFSPPSQDGGSVLASGSWDMTVKLWDVFGKQGVLENLEHNSEVVSCDFHPFLKNELVSTTLGGQMLLWDADQG